MIPDHVKEFMSSTLMSHTASRDAQLQPYIIRGFGVKAHPNQTTVTFYIAELHSEQMIENFEKNGRVALTVSEPLSFEAYQLKGKFISWRRNNKQDDQFVDEYQTQIYEKVTKMGIPEEIFTKWNIWMYKPCVAITFDVEEVFGQTPRPETGELISEKGSAYQGYERGLEPQMVRKINQMQSIPDELQPALQGFVPGTVGTCSLDAEPNVTFITQAYYVDEHHIALSRQFFNKTAKNVTENPKAHIQVFHPETGEDWRLVAEYERSEPEGDLFDSMEMQLEAIASTTGMTDVFNLLSADIYAVISIERCNR